MLKGTFLMGFFPGKILKKEVQRATKRKSTLDIKRTSDKDFSIMIQKGDVR